MLSFRGASTMVDEDLLSWILGRLGERKRVALVTVVEKKGSAPRGPGAKMAVAEDGDYKGTVGGGELERIAVARALEAIASGTPTTLKVNLFRTDVISEGTVHTRSQLCGGSVTLFVDVLRPVPRAFIVGAGHVVRNLSALLSMLGYRVTVIDNNPEHASRELLPEAHEVIVTGDVPGALEGVDFSKDDILVVAHGDADLELEVLKRVYSKATLPGYVGFLSGRGKLAYVLRELVVNGISKEKIAATLYSPAGLAIGSETPEEIAVAIVAEALKVLRRATGVHENLVKEILASMG